MLQYCDVACNSGVQGHAHLPEALIWAITKLEWPWWRYMWLEKQHRGFQHPGEAKITRKFVHLTIKRFSKTGTVEDRPRLGRWRIMPTKQLLNAVKGRIQRNPVRKQSVVARNIHISLLSISHVLHNNLSPHMTLPITHIWLYQKVKTITYPSTIWNFKKYWFNYWAHKQTP